MKKLLLAVLVGLTIAACSKKTDVVKPDAASTVAGVYNLSYYRLDSAAVPIDGPYNLPLSQNGSTIFSGTITAVKVAADSIKLNAHYVVSGVPDNDFSYGTFYLKPSGASYTLSYTQSGVNTQIGTIDGKSLSIDASAPDSDNPKTVDRLVIISVR